MKEMSHISQRMVCDSVDVAGSILNVPITKKIESMCGLCEEPIQGRGHFEVQERQKLEDANHRKKRCIDDVKTLGKEKKKKN